MALAFTDYFAGSGRAVVADGFYLVSPQSSGQWRAQKSDGKEWVWDGGMFPAPDKAEQACQYHADD